MGNRAHLFQHMLNDHGFNVGQPDNIGEGHYLIYIYRLILWVWVCGCVWVCAVFSGEFLDLLQEKLDK